MQIHYLPPNEFFQLLEHWRYALIAMTIYGILGVTLVLWFVIPSYLSKKFHSRSRFLSIIVPFWLMIAAPFIGYGVAWGVYATLYPVHYELGENSSHSTLSMAPYHANLESPEQNAKRATYSQKDYDIGSTDQVKSLHQVDGDHYIHPLVEGWYDVGQGKVKGPVSTPQGKVLGLKHGDPSSQFVQLRYEIQGEQKTAVVTLSDDQFVKLYQCLSNHFNPAKRETFEKPIGISELENGDLVIDNYSN